MDSINLIARNGEAVRQALELGELLHIDTASEEITDEFLLFAINSRLLDQWADAFPDPRHKPEIGMRVLLASSIAARLAKLYSIRNTGYVLQSARVLGALGYSIHVTEPGQGLSTRGTEDGSVHSGDVLRKLLVKMESEVVVEPQVLSMEQALTTKAVRAEAASKLPARIKVRERLSRREVKAEINPVEAAARGQAVCTQLVEWYNEHVGLRMLEYARLGSGRRLHILDATPIEVALETETYECSGVVKNDDGTYSRGYKLATLRTLLDTAGILTQVEIGPIQMHDLELCRAILHESAALRKGDLVIEDRGFLDGKSITELKSARKVDVIVPLRSNMHSYREAVAIAGAADQWQKHPSREDQQIAFVTGVEHVWDECEVALNAGVIRYYNEKKQKTAYIVLVTTDLELNGEWIVRHYEERPEVEQDYQQMKSGGWQLQKLSTTRYSEIVWYVLSVVTSYSLYQLFANTQAGSRFANKTRQAIALEQIRTHRTHVIVYAGGYFEIYETLSFVNIVIRLPAQVQERLRSWFDARLNNVKKQE